MATIGLKNELENVIENNGYFALLEGGVMMSKGFYLSGNGYAYPLVTKFDSATPAASAVWQRTGENEAHCILFHVDMLKIGAKWAVEFPSFVIEWARGKVNAD